MTSIVLYYIKNVNNLIIINKNLLITKCLENDLHIHFDNLNNIKIIIFIDLI